MRKERLILILLIIFAISILNAYDLSNKINIYSNYNHNSSNDSGEIGIEYYPGIKFELYQKKQMEIDCFAEGKFKANALISEETDYSWDGELYRCWLRSVNPNSELRLGLQKINFGSAVYLRPLQWFDKIDPRDSRNRTDGVLAALLRYYLVDNSNFWFWGILDGDDDEYFQSAEGSISMGARMQLPILGGEIAITYHQRELGGITEDEYSPLATAHNERKYGFDGRWDYIAGYWIESSWSVLDNIPSQFSHSEYYTLGSDYTFGIGNGLHVLGEVMLTATGDSFLVNKSRYEQFYAFSTDTPLGMYDNISGLALYNSISEDIYYYLSYGMTFDYYKLNINITLSPDDAIESTQIGFSKGKTIGIEMQIDF